MIPLLFATYLSGIVVAYITFMHHTFNAAESAPVYQKRRRRGVLLSLVWFLTPLVCIYLGFSIISERFK